MASQAEIAALGSILVRDGQTGKEEGISGGLGHHAASPVERRFDLYVIASVAIIALVRGFEIAGLVRLRPGEEKIVDGGRHGVYLRVGKMKYQQAQKYGYC